MPSAKVSKSGSRNTGLQCWYCSSGISSDASLSKSQRYVGEPVEVKRPTESGAQNTLREALIFADGLHAVKGVVAGLTGALRWG